MSDTMDGFENMTKSWCHENGYWMSSPITMTYRKPVIGVSIVQSRYYNAAIHFPGSDTRFASIAAHAMLANWRKLIVTAPAAH